MDDFEIATGKITGRDHVTMGKNDQDALCYLNTENAIIAVVCDGCGSSAHSEVGAKIGSHLIVNGIMQQIRRIGDKDVQFDSDYFTRLLERVRQDTLTHFRSLAMNMSDIISYVVGEYFLFTVVGVMITKWGSVIFSLGDGTLFLNGDKKSISFPNNKPPYLAYALIGSEFDPESLKFQIHHVLPTEEIQSVLVGTDGIEDFINASNRNIPGKDKVVGPINQFWEDDRYFSNPDNIRRKLYLANKTSQRIDWKESKQVKEPGLLSDDTALIVIRRRTIEGSKSSGSLFTKMFGKGGG